MEGVGTWKWVETEIDNIISYGIRLLRIYYIVYGYIAHKLQPRGKPETAKLDDEINEGVLEQSQLVLQ